MQVRRIVKHLFPSRVRRRLRVLHREFVFRRAMKRFLESPEVARNPGSRVLSDLIYGWGNEGWSARDEYLVECIAHAMTARGPILECGSGLSTILVGAIAKQRGQRHWALEHLPAWAAKVQKYLDQYHLDSVTLYSTPLRDHGEFEWYDAPVDAMPGNFALVVCDGPPGGTKGGRYGLVPIMSDRLATGCTILLDDVVREQERAIARRWEAETGAAAETLGARKRYVRLTVTDRQLQRPA
jgi:hypothetical protein